MLDKSNNSYCAMDYDVPVTRPTKIMKPMDIMTLDIMIHQSFQPDKTEGINGFYVPFCEKS
ncbi:hypothetical protein FF38_04456 [Lucilia cuprina]|uniref:Uncharacterized protein n=1 Tax=Lucilia cuprina TaxID=7375 RepID=A0A0L0C9H4_LUCCU|nr:hypothetical protein FF38_04456 [Lucilia cuprina]